MLVVSTHRKNKLSLEINVKLQITCMVVGLESLYIVHSSRLWIYVLCHLEQRQITDSNHSNK